MKIDAMGIILSKEEKIPPITDIRSPLALPISGRYRLIDFILSNMANARITNVGVVTSSNYSSLMDHIKSGSPWDLDRKKQGLNILPPNMRRVQDGQIRGDIDMLAGVYDFIRRSHQTYVILSLGTHLYNMDFAKLVETHVDSQADITVVYKNLSGAEETELSRFTLLEINKDGRVTDMEKKPYYPKNVTAGMDIYVMEKELLLSIIDECSARGDHDFVKDAVLKKIEGLMVMAYEHKGYADKIDSLKSYYRNNMNFLNSDIREELLSNDNPIYTKFKDQSPTRYGDEARVENSLIADGCIIAGTVINSVLSRGVVVKAGAVVKNSIIMQNSVIENNVELDNVVFDKEVYISEGKKLMGQEVYPLAIEKGSVI